MLQWCDEGGAFLFPLHLSLAPLGISFVALRVAEVKRWCGKVLKVFTSIACKQFLKLSRLLISDKPEQSTAVGCPAVKLAAECARVARERKGARGKTRAPPVHPGGAFPSLPSLRQVGAFCSSTNRAKKIDTFVRTNWQKRIDKYGNRVYNKPKTLMRVNK